MLLKATSRTNGLSLQDVVHIICTDFAIPFTSYKRFNLLLNSYHVRGDFCRLLINFANSLAQDHDRQNHLAL